MTVDEALAAITAFCPCAGTSTQAQIRSILEDLAESVAAGSSEFGYYWKDTNDR